MPAAWGSAALAAANDAHGLDAIADMVGGGPFGLKPGQWTDDTSMALCLAASLAETGRFDPADQMRRYLRWYRQGYMSATGTCFGSSRTPSGGLMGRVSKARR